MCATGQTSPYFDYKGLTADGCVDERNVSSEPGVAFATRHSYTDCANGSEASLLLLERADHSTVETEDTTGTAWEFLRAHRRSPTGCTPLLLFGSGFALVLLLAVCLLFDLFFFAVHLFAFPCIFSLHTSL